MKILDKNTDFYDYLQYVYRDDTYVFDRRDSFVLTKEELCYRLEWYDHTRKTRYMLLQVCNTFWLFKANLEYDKIYSYRVTDYSLALIGTWKDYNAQRVLYKLCTIKFDFFKMRRLPDEMNSSELIDAVKHRNYETIEVLNKFTIYSGDHTKKVKTIPLLSECGLSKYIEPLDIYLSLEEYFSLEKSSSERTEPLGATNEDKITRHGFDLKSSFRGKR